MASENAGIADKSSGKTGLNFLKKSLLKTQSSVWSFKEKIDREGKQDEKSGLFNSLKKKLVSRKAAQWGRKRSKSEDKRRTVGAEEEESEERSQSVSLTEELLKLAKYGWYWGPISSEEAERKLEGEPDGAFLVRDSFADNYLLSISFRCAGKSLHTRIEHNSGLFSFYQQSGFAGIKELIDDSVYFSKSAVFCYSRPRSPGHPAFPVRLTKPLSRFTRVRSLQYLSRFVIRQYTSVDNIRKLPLPHTLIVYIEEGHY